MILLMRYPERLLVQEKLYNNFCTSAIKKEYFLKKKLMDPQAPKLIDEIVRKFGHTEDELEQVLGISQQTVSNYRKGKIKKERFDVITKLRAILEGKLHVPRLKKSRARELNKIATLRGMTDAVLREKAGGARSAAKTSTKK